MPMPRSEADIRRMIDAYERTLALPDGPRDPDPFAEFKNAIGQMLMKTHADILRWVLNEGTPEINSAMLDTLKDAKDLPPVKKGK